MTSMSSQSPSVSRSVTSFGRGLSLSPTLASHWFTSGAYADELVALTGHGRSATDAVGELHSLVAQFCRILVSLRHEQAEHQITRLESMRHAADGWDGYKASTPVQTTINLAAELLRQFADCGLPIPTATMSPSGNAALFSCAPGVYLDIELHADNSVSWLLQLPSGPEVEAQEPFDGTHQGLRVVEILKHAAGAIV